MSVTADPKPQAPRFVTLKIHRFTPHQGHFWTTYRVPYTESLSVLTALRTIYEQIDPSLVIRQEQCLRGNCTVCEVRIDGKIKKACSVPLTDQDTVVIEPKNPARVIRDLVCAPR
jgi:succinate dehydrogenase/fumarate reductase-like Fe-S protein